MEQSKALEGWVARLRSEDYLTVRAENGRRFHGGNQNWYEQYANLEDIKRQGARSRYRSCRRDENYRLASLGCGVIAMINLETYLLKRLDLNNKKEVTSSIGEISREGYEKYAGERWKHAYHIGKSYLNYKTGLYPWKMERGLKDFFAAHGLGNRKVIWAPYFLKTPREQTRLVLEVVQGMLGSDCPVVFSYHTFQPKEKSLVMYQSLESAIQGSKASKGDASVESHYMTIIGLYHSEASGYVMKVESWGRIYYIRFDAFSKMLSYFTNILYVETGMTEGKR